MQENTRYRLLVFFTPRWRYTISGHVIIQASRSGVSINFSDFKYIMGPDVGIYQYSSSREYQSTSSTEEPGSVSPWGNELQVSVFPKILYTC